MSNPYAEWEPVIGLEIHVELNTKSKLFSPAPNRFGDEPNTNITPICTGHPGTLPVLNVEAVRKAVAFGCAIGANIEHYSRFDRKSYFYPDSPRNFQITQYSKPLILGGSVTVEVEGEEKVFTIDRAHLEDDAGMLKHFPHFAGLDDNRAGVPLLEIVSTPCLRSAKDAVAYAQMIKAIMQYIDASDCNMEEGSLRMDVNISVRKKGETSLRNKVEIKNMNSFTFMAIAIDSEIKRQTKAYLEVPHDDPKKVVLQSTYRFDPDRRSTILMRTKESADDYRYFTEPDLPPLILETEFIDSVRQSLPELPYGRKKRYLELGLSSEAATILTQDKKLSDFFDEAYPFCKNAKGLGNWIIVEFAGRLKDKNLYDTQIPPKHIGDLIAMIDQGKVTGKIAKQIADQMILQPTKSIEQIIEENPAFRPMEDLSMLESIIDSVLKENAQSVSDFLDGNQRAFGFLVGQVMKQTEGKAPPPIVNKLLKEKIGKA